MTRPHIHNAAAAVLIVLLLAPLAAGVMQSDNREADRKAIRAHIESIFEAFVSKDRPELRETHGADWRGFTPWSERPIRGVEGYMNEATFPPNLPKDEGMVGWKISEFDIVFYGDTAVVSFSADLDRRYAGQTSHEKINLLDVYHKDRGGWIQVASNTSLHPDALARMTSERRDVGSEERAEVLAVREQVWRTWFAGDTVALGKLVPPELITIDGDTGKFGSRESTLIESREFAESGGKLTRLVFPRTDIQAYGDTVILYTTFEMDLSMSGKINTTRGTAIEVFVHQPQGWTHTGWQLATAR